MNPWSELSKKLTAQYILDETYQVTVVGSELEEIEGAGTDLYESIQELETQGYFPESAIEKAVNEKVIVSQAPDGYSFVRLTGKGLKPVTIMVPRDQL